MNAMQMRGRWTQVRGEFRTRWCCLTDDRSGRMSGRLLKLKGKITVWLGRARESAKKKAGKLNFLRGRSDRR